jgi:hypothetical protein
MSDTVSSLAQKLRPYWLRDVGASGGGIVAGSGGGGLTAHALNGPYHTGELDPDQAPWAVTDTEFAIHAANPDAHHARQHVLATGTALGPDHTISGAVAGHVLKATASNAARMAQLMVPELGATGASWDVAALTAANTVGLRTPSSDVRAGAAEALLKSNAAGELGLKGLAIGAAMILAGGGNIDVEPDIQFIGNALLATEGSLYLALDSDNNVGSGSAFIIGHNAATSAMTELFRLGDNGEFRITATAPTITTAANGLTIAPADSITLTPGASNRLYLSDGKAFRTLDFASGFTGYGFQLDQGITTAGKTTLMLDDLTVRGRMYVYELLIRQIRATNGSVFVSSTAKVKRVVAITGGYRLYTTEAGETPTATTDHAHGFLPGDLIRAQRTRWNGTTLVQIYQSNLRVTIVDDLYTFRAALVSGDAPEPGMEFVRLGNDGTTANRQGTVYLTADDDSAPFVDVVDGVAAHSQWNTAGKIKVSMGKLTGITTVANEYGLIAGAGGFADTDQWLKASSEGVKLNNTELRMWNGAVNTGVWYPSGQFDIGFDGVSAIDERDFTIHTSGYVRMGRQTANFPNLLYSQTGGYVALRNGTVQKIRFDDDGNSYFAGVMTIGAAGEIRRGRGAGNGLHRPAHLAGDGSMGGLIAGYNANVVQWSADTDGKMRAGGGTVELGAGGVVIVSGPTLTGQVLTGENRLTFRSYLNSAHLNGWIGAADIGASDKYLDVRSYGVNNQNLLLAAETTVAGKTASVQISATNQAGTVSSIFVNPGGVSVFSGGAVAFRNPSGSAFQALQALQITLSNGFVTSDAAVQFWNTPGTALQQIRAGSLMASNTGSHFSRVPASGIYSLGAVGIGVTAVPAAGVMLDVAGQTYMRAAMTLDGALYLDALAAAPAAVAGYLPIYLTMRRRRSRRAAGRHNSHNQLGIGEDT